MISKSSNIFLAGHNGMVGSAIFNRLKKDGYTVLRLWQSELEQHPEECLKKIIKVMRKQP